MLKIDIDDSGKSIYKAINYQEIMLYKISGDSVNDINLIHRLEEIAFHYLSNHHDSSCLFNDLTQEVDNIIEGFTHNDIVENRLENSMIRL